MDEHGPFGDKPLIFQTSTIMGGRALKNTKQLGPAKTLENQWIMKVSKFPFIKSEQIIFPLRNSGLLLKIRRTGNCIQRTIPTGRDHLCTLNQGFEQPSVRKSKSTKLWFMVVVGSPCDPWIIYQPDQPLCLFGRLDFKGSTKQQLTHLQQLLPSLKVFPRLHFPCFHPHALAQGVLSNSEIHGKNFHVQSIDGC